MSAKPTDSQELKLGPGWTTLSKNAPQQNMPSPSSDPPAPPSVTPSSTAPRITYSKSELLDLYELASTTSIPATMSKYHGLTSSEPLVPVNIAPDDHSPPPSVLAEPAESPNAARARFQSATPRPGVEAILRRDNPHASHGLAANPPVETPTSVGTPSKKTAHVTQAGRDFWSGSAVLAAAERPNATATSSERRPLPLKPRSVAVDRASSPNGHANEKPAQPYWSRSNSRAGADFKSNWRGGATANPSVASGGVKYPGASADEVSPADRGPGSQSQNPRKAAGDSAPPSQHPSHGAIAGAGRSAHTREGGLFSRNNKDALKPTNTRDLSALAKGSSRDPAAASNLQHHDRDIREARHHGAGSQQARTHAEMLADEEKSWFYRDPQGNIQGPFSSSQLIQWEKDGYYDAELPVSKSREHGFKPLAIAFGMRKEEVQTASPPPGFVNSSAALKNDGPRSSSPMSMRPSREEQNRRGTRTVEEMAQEVEMMRLQARNKRLVDAGNAETVKGSAVKESSFFDSHDGTANRANGHSVAQEELGDRVADVNKADEVKEAPITDKSEVVVAPAVGALSSKGADDSDPPISQSRFASFMRQGNDSREDQSQEVSRGGFGNQQVTSTSQRQGHYPADEQPAKDSNRLGLGESAAGTARTVDPPSPDPRVATAWTSMIVGVQQQQQPHETIPAQPTKPASASEQDLMAIDPAIAHASFSQSSIKTPSPPSPRVSANELPPWLHLSSGIDTGKEKQVHDTLQDSATLPVQQSLHVPPSTHFTAHEQAQMQAQVQAQAQARAQAEARAHAELLRQAQLHARQLQAHQQAQAQQQAQARAAQQASALAQAQARVNPQEQQWILRHRLTQLQATYDGTYRAHLETTRSMQAAQAAVSSSLPGTPENQNARAIHARLSTVLKEQALQLARIKSAAESTHLLLQHSVVAVQGQQHQGQGQGSIPSPTATGNVSPHSLTQVEVHSPKQTFESSIPPVSSPSPVPSPEIPLPVPADRKTYGNSVPDKPGSPLDARRDLNATYETLDTDEQGGWETVTRKAQGPAGDMHDNQTDTAIAESLPTNEPEAQQMKESLQVNPRRVTEGAQAANIAFQPEAERRSLEATEDESHDVLSEAGKSAKNVIDTTPTIAPWSKTNAEQGTGNGLSLREIQRQEELRRKADEKTAVAQHERDETAKAVAARWNVTGQPWGGARDPSKQQSLSFKEKMRLEEEQKKKAAVLTRNTGPLVQTQAPVGGSRPLTTKTGWASLVAKNSRPPPPVRKPVAPVVNKRSEDDAPFWETVGAPSNSAVPNSGRSGKQSFADRVSQSTHATAPSRPSAAKAPVATPSGTRKIATHAKASKIEERDTSPARENTVIGRRVSNEFARWCSESLKQLTGNKIQDTVMFDYLVAIKSPSEVRDTILQNLGANDKTRSFADEFIRRLEFERSSVVADAGSGGAGNRKKGRRHRTAKVDPSLVLGFTSTSSRIMQGTIETPEMK